MDHLPFLFDLSRLVRGAKFETQVGSGFELDQRLDEPPVATTAGQDELLHSFDVEQSKPIQDIWRQRAAKSALELRQKTLAVVDGRVQIAQGPDKSQPIREDSLLGAKPPSLPESILQHSTGPIFLPSLTETERSCADENGSLTPEGKRQARTAAETLCRTLENTQSTQSQESKHDLHTRRWASYSNLSSSFDPDRASAEIIEQAEENLNDTKHAKECKPLLGQFEEELAKFVRPVPITESEKSDHSQPLLALFEEELAKLVKPAPTESGNAGTIRTQNPSSSSNHDQDPQAPPYSAAPSGSSSFAETRRSMPQPSTTPGDVGEAVHNLFGGITQIVSSALPIASRFAGREISIPPNVTEVHQKFTQNVSQTLKDIDAGIASLRSRLDERPRAPAGSQQRSTAFTADDLPELAPSTTASNPPAGPTGDQSRELDAKQQSPRKTSNKRYKVSRIIGRRYIQYNDLMGPRKLQYLVRWDGRGPEEDVWYDADNLKSCIHLLHRYKKDNPERVGHPLMIPSSEESQEAEQLHIRTAGDRMITSRSSRLKPSSTDCETELQLNHGLAELFQGTQGADSAPPRDQGPTISSLTTESSSKSSKAPVESVRNPVFRPTEDSQIRSGRERAVRTKTTPEGESIGEAPFVHPDNGFLSDLEKTRGFQFSPSDIMAKFPPVSSIEKNAQDSLRTKENMQHLEPHSNVREHNSRSCTFARPHRVKDSFVGFNQGPPWEGRGKARQTWVQNSSSDEKLGQQPRQGLELNNIPPPPAVSRDAQANSNEDFGPNSAKSPIRRAKSLAFYKRPLTQEDGKPHCFDNISQRSKRPSVWSLNDKYSGDTSLSRSKWAGMALDDPEEITSNLWRRHPATTLEASPPSLSQRFPHPLSGLGPNTNVTNASTGNSQNLIDLHDATPAVGSGEKVKATDDIQRPPLASVDAPTPVSGNARSTAIKKCVAQLTEMGFSENKARTVAETVNGALDTALDVLDEDRRASQTFWGTSGGRQSPSENRFAGEGLSRPRTWESNLWMPGAW